MPYEIEFAVSVKPYLNALSANHRARVLQAIENQLVHDPLVETRKRLRPNPVAPWELRVGLIVFSMTWKKVKPSPAMNNLHPREPYTFWRSARKRGMSFASVAKRFSYENH